MAATALDASLLLLPLVGFLPPEDPRIRGTVAAIERELLRDGLVLRYDTRPMAATACRPARACSSPAASGWPTTSCCRAASRRRARCSSGCWRCATMSGCWPRSTIRGRPAGRQLPAGLLPYRPAGDRL
jgi:hypothetical protein